MNATVTPARALSPGVVARWSELQLRDRCLASPFFRPEFTQAVAQVRNDLPTEAEAPVIELQTADNQFAAMYLGFSQVHAQTPDGRYLNRVTTDVNGQFTIHVPDGPVMLTPTVQGWDVPTTATTVDGADARLVLPRHSDPERHPLPVSRLGIQRGRQMPEPAERTG